MRVSIIGQAAFGEAVFKRLSGVDGVEVGCVSAPMQESRPDALWAAAQAAGVPMVSMAALKTEDGLSQWTKSAGDVSIMAFVTEILPESVFGAARFGTIQYHPSLLPAYRGMSSINWPIIFGESETGVTVFWPDAGIDSGPILLQKRCAIGPDDTVGSLYFERLFPMGVEAIAEAVAMVAAGNAPRLEQDHRLATNQPPCGDKHAQIPWYGPADRVYSLIRGCNPQPGAWTTFRGETIRIFDCRLESAPEAGASGRILRVDEEGFDVRLNGGILRVTRVQATGQKKVGAGEWAESVGLVAGNRLR